MEIPTENNNYNDFCIYIHLVFLKWSFFTSLTRGFRLFCAIFTGAIRLVAQKISHFSESEDLFPIMEEIGTVPHKK